MTSKVWMCRQCGTLIEKPNCPASTKCPAGGVHRWQSLGTGSIMPGNGLDAWQCDKCGAVVYMKRCPPSIACPGGGNHRWKKL